MNIDVMDRRSFVATVATAGVGALVAPSRVWGGASTPYPFVDGLSFLPEDLSDIGRSGLSAFILDVSAVERVETDDGSIRYYRSFDASVQALVATRRALLRDEIPGAFLATRGSDVARAWRDGSTAVFLQFQGAQPLEGELWRVDVFHELGLRVMQLTHHNANPFAGGALDAAPTGLTEAGHDLVARMNELGMIPDISHASDQTAMDVTAASTRPVILSHGAARAFVRNARCAPDEVIRAVADTGGVMGIFMMSFWLTEDPVPTVDHLIAQIRHVARVGGIDAVAIANDYPVSGQAELIALGNDNEEGVKAYHEWWRSVAAEGVLGFDAERLPRHVVIPELNQVRRMFVIDRALSGAGFSPSEREKIMGGNWIRVLEESLG
ncbi:MAG: dipeptidase [Gemmatimonadota bacterium]|nr:dipeptidase [Gemmatimonadota bacterium]MDH5758545.1 dipeptidase [Gemmatimonadota bacterium]